MGMTEIRRAIMRAQPHLRTVSGGNTVDSAVIAHFNANMTRPVEQLTVNLPYKSNGYTAIKITACGINLLQCDQFTNGAARNVQLTGYRNEDGEIMYITAIGTSNSDNTFRNLNYILGQYRWPPDGAYATYAYSENATIPFVNDGTPTSPKDRNGLTVTDSAGTWKLYDLVHYDTHTSEWTRVQLVPYASNGFNFNTTFYPLICLEQDKGCNFEPYNGKTYTITFPTTIYGGVVNPLSGTVINEYSSSGSTISPNTYSFTPINAPIIKNGVNNIWSDFGIVTVKYWQNNI